MERPQRRDRRLHRRSVPRAAESVAVVFDEAGEPVHEGIFAAYPNRPAAALLVRPGRGKSGNKEAVVPGIRVE